MNDSVLTLLTENGFTESTYDQYEKDMKDHSSDGIQFMQVAALTSNMNILSRRIPPFGRRFYVVRLANKVDDIRAWGHCRKE